MKPKNSILLTVAYSAFLLVPAVAVADTDPAAFNADKERQIAIVLEKVQTAQRNLSCVQEAQDHAALKICEEDFKQKFAVPETEAKQPCPDKKVQKSVKSKKKQ
ncbi:MAG: hypothetical protein ACXWTY_14220 [Methylobacter sp.]